MSRSRRAAERHFSGSNTQYVIDYLRVHTPAGTVEDVLARAGETRSVATLSDEATWSTYDQFRRLLEATAGVLGGPRRLAAIGTNVFNRMSTPEFTEILQQLGSPSVLYENLGQTSQSLSLVVEVSGTEVGPSEWLVEQRFVDGFPAFEEFCGYSSGLIALVPRLFGYPPADVSEEQCQVHGADACRFRVRWEAIDDPVRLARYHEMRADVVEARLESLQHTVADLVSADDLDGALTRIVRAAARAVRAPAYVLAIDRSTFGRQLVYSDGLATDEAERIAEELLERAPNPHRGRLVVDVVSTRREYGRLAAIGDAFFAQEQSILEAYGRLAAAALDSASALEEARLQAATASALLALSTALAEVTTREEIATRLARAVPTIVDCDRALVVLRDDADGLGRVAGAFGYSPEAEAHLRTLTFPPRPTAGAHVQYLALDAPTTPDYVPVLDREQRSTAAATVPIVDDGGHIGYVVATVVQDPRRLVGAPDLEDRLIGLAAQASTALRNARLLAQVRHQALHDSLTGLPNRGLILDRAEQLLARARRGTVGVAALFIDLDGFKDVNDTLGHSAGDHLLQAVANRLAATVRSSDTIGRLGGDEFVVLAEDPNPTLLAERILDVLREPFEIGGTVLTITASIGIADGDRPSVGELLRHADVALYRAKASGKNRHVVFHQEMQQAVQDRVQFEADLAVALDTGQYFLVYQPIVDLDTGEPTGAEALLRWRHPTEGILEPDRFITLLEDTGRIVDVGAWVLEVACDQAVRWRERGLHLDMSVNVSARQLDSPRFLDDLQRVLERSGLEPTGLIVEITETALMRDTQSTIRMLHDIKDLGVRIAVDDFGTGYSSLAYLRQFPVDAIKVDASFVAAMCESSDTEVLAHTLVQLGRTLGLGTVAEGIETAEQVDRLRAHDCQSGQGFLFAAPVDAAALEARLATTPTFAVSGRATATYEPR